MTHAERIKSIGAQLRNAREKKGISLRAMASKVKRSPSYLSKIERGLVLGSGQLYIDLCHILGLSPGWALDNLGIMDSGTSAIARKAFGLNPYRFREVLYGLIEEEEKPKGLKRS